MIPRGKLHISYKDLAFGVYYCFTNRFRFSIVNTDLHNVGKLICLSVRTGFDLVLSTLDLPAGSEVLVTDINIPDMFTIISGHQLKSVPIPVNKRTLNISSSDVEAAITPDTRALLITHLFGSIMDTEELIAVAKKHNLVIIEDCAQAYAGDLYEGHPDSDVVMFSFGFIKTNTAVRGAIMRIKDAGLHNTIAMRNEGYPQKTNTDFFKKLTKAIVVRLLTNKYIYTACYKLTIALGKDFEKVLNGVTKGFPGADIFQQIRYRPSMANQLLLQRKLRYFNHHDITARIELANDILPNIPQNYLIGSKSHMHSHWVLPVETNHPEELITYLRKNGFDASQKASSLIRLDRNVQGLLSSQELALTHLVYLPVYPQMSKKERNRLTQLITGFLG